MCECRGHLVLTINEIKYLKAFHILLFYIKWQNFWNPLSINQNRLEKNYCKALKSYLNINIKGMPIDEQFNKLKSYKLLPLRLRQFQNLVYFIFSLVKSNRMNSLLETINSFKKKRVTRNVFKEPISNTNPNGSQH